jgi:Heterokaryon incompatibility protein (HET)
MGIDFRLRNNIYQALKAVLRLRARNRSSDQVCKSTPRIQGLQKKLAQNEYFWIDSICIRQTCDREKTHQICLMDKIFSHAQVVVAWLGPSSEGSIEAMESIRSYAPPDDMKIVNFSMSPVLFPENLQRSIVRFGRLEYWSRAWIIQEFLLAKDVLVLWGDESLPWNKLKDLLLGCAMFLGAPLKHARYEHMD